jgi:hypothetical protein
MDKQTGAVLEAGAPAQEVGTRRAREGEVQQSTAKIRFITPQPKELS